jgi:hypothetical protein
MKARYLDLLFPLSEKGWHWEWFYLPNVGLALHPFSVDRVGDNALESWASLPSGAEAHETKTLLDAIGWLTDRGSTRPMVIRTFMARHILPLKARAHAMWDYIRTKDLTIESDKFIPHDSLDCKMWILLGSLAQDFGKATTLASTPIARRDLGLQDSPFMGMSSNP